MVDDVLEEVLTVPGGIDERESRDTQEGQGWDLGPNSWTWLGHHRSEDGGDEGKMETLSLTGRVRETQCIAPLSGV